ncbi:hypothetical protein phiOC_p301 [Ochrobactrum phage vB_OspM_OC]|nr:hypothetical protein phiOC_p301 [Ochrobactrum phage vB_OspM_OC]
MNRLGIDGAAELIPDIRKNCGLFHFRLRDDDRFLLDYSGQTIDCNLWAGAFYSLESMLHTQEAKENNPNGEGGFSISLTRLNFHLGKLDKNVNFSKWQVQHSSGGKVYPRHKGISRSNLPYVCNLHWFLLMANSMVNVDKTKEICDDYELTPDSVFVLANGDIICRVGGALVFGFSPYTFSRDFFIETWNQFSETALRVRTSEYNEVLPVTNLNNANFLIDEILVYEDDDISVPRFLNCIDCHESIEGLNIKFGKLFGENLKKMLTVQKK